MSSSRTIKFSAEHIAARDRHRRMQFNFDTGWGGDLELDGSDIQALTAKWFSRLRGDPESQVDTVSWCWSEGGWAPYPGSKVLPVYDGYRKWIDAGVDPVRIALDQAKKHGLENWFSYRVNSEADFVGIAGWSIMTPTMKAHPEWLLPTIWPQWKVYNFEIPEVRVYKLGIIREAVERYDFDGFEIDLRSGGGWALPQGRRWEKRGFLTEFMRSVRQMTLEEEKKQGRPILLIARVSDCVEGCHLDGFDIETWARERLVDILMVGGRSMDVDILGFRKATQGTGVRIIPYNDDCHASNGYTQPPIEVFRGVFTNFWNQGPDGVGTFNFFVPWAPNNGEHCYVQLWHELGSPHTLRFKDKTFVVQRRFGEGGIDIARMGTYFGSNRFAQLPVKLINDGNIDTTVFLMVGDDVSQDADRVKKVTLRLVLSDPYSRDLPPEARIAPDPFLAWDVYPKEFLIPPAKGIEDGLEVTLNGVVLGRARVAFDTVHLGCDDIANPYLVFEVNPDWVAFGRNVVGIRVTNRDPAAKEEMSVEKVELLVKYK
jgi:hypothetical protein